MARKLTFTVALMVEDRASRPLSDLAGLAERLRLALERYDDIHGLIWGEDAVVTHIAVTAALESPFDGGAK